RNIARPGHDDRRRWVIGEEPHAHCRGEHRTDLRLDYCDPGIRERHLLGANESSEDALLHPRLEPVDTTDDVDVFARGGDAVLRDGHTSNLDVEIALLRAQGGLFRLRQLRWTDAGERLERPRLRAGIRRQAALQERRGSEIVIGVEGEGPRVSRRSEL